MKLILTWKLLNGFMYKEMTRDLSHFFVAGVNYKKTDLAVRGLFSINSDQYEKILKKAYDQGLREIFILSTCNRTEIYGFSENAQLLIELLCSETEGSISLFENLAYIKSGEKAINHLYSVAAGLDSQILGDYEVVGQVKKAARFSKQHQCLGTFSERIVNSVIQVSKMIKNNTTLSSGTVSVAGASVPDKIPLKISWIIYRPAILP
ncbi:MAG: glutamyl-tRNA reductase [Chitinophagaceae bacterium]